MINQDQKSVKEVYDSLNKSTKVIVKKEFCEHFGISRTSFDNRMSEDSFDFVERDWLKKWFSQRGLTEVLRAGSHS